MIEIHILNATSSNYCAIIIKFIIYICIFIIIINKLWLHGKDGKENKMLRGPNMMLSCWILDLLMETVEEYGMKMNNNTLWCLKKNLFNHRTLELLLVSVHQCDGAVMPRLLPLMSRFLRILSMEVGCAPTPSTSSIPTSTSTNYNKKIFFLDGGFETQQFATLAQVTSQRYAREQLSMLRPSAGGVPVYSLYCQRLVELMVDVHRASKSLTETKTNNKTSTNQNVQAGTKKEEETKSAGNKNETINRIAAINSTAASIAPIASVTSTTSTARNTTSTTSTTTTSTTSTSSTARTSSSVRALSRRYNISMFGQKIRVQKNHYDGIIWRWMDNNFDGCN